MIELFRKTCSAITEHQGAWIFRLLPAPPGEAGEAAFHSLRYVQEIALAPLATARLPLQPGTQVLTYMIEGSLDLEWDTEVSEKLTIGDLHLLAALGSQDRTASNPSGTETCRWLEFCFGGPPELPGTVSRKVFMPEEDWWERFCVLASPDGRENSLKLLHDALILGAVLEPSQVLTYAPSAGRGAWLQLVRGQASVNGHILAAGDGAEIDQESGILIECMERAEILLLDLG